MWAEVPKELAFGVLQRTAERIISNTIYVERALLLSSFSFLVPLPLRETFVREK